MSARTWSLSAESITALAAVVTAVVALGVGVWENTLMRQYYRLSVLPRLDFQVQIGGPPSAPDEESPGDSLHHASIWLVNEGVGPGIIGNVEIRLPSADGTDTVYPSWEAALPALAAAGVHVGTHVEMSDEAVLGVGRRQILLRIEGQDSDAIRRVIDTLGIDVDYRSIYGEEFETDYNVGAGG